MNRVDVLDHGYCEPVEFWGSDERVIESARMSTGKGFNGWGPRCKDCGAGFDAQVGVCDLHVSFGGHSRCTGTEKVAGDEKLLRYLWENKHSTPFEMAGATFEIQAPIFVFREWHRHRVPFGYSEMSARYTPLPDMNYVPTVERLLVNSKTNTQAGTVKGAAELDAAGAETFRGILADTYFQLESLYQSALKNGVPKELARIILPVGRYSRMRATGNLRGWLNFLALRNAPNAQFEIRQYAVVIASQLAQKFPRTLALFAEGCAA